MKIILPGYEGTKKVLSANSYFINKYMPGFDVYFLNFGKFTGKLYCGKFISLDNEQYGGKRAWKEYVVKYLNSIDDELIIFADGDFFITQPYNQENYEKLLEEMNTKLVGYMSCGEDNKRFSRVAQYAIWNRKFLLEVLENAGASTIWKFESRGARYINNIDKEKNIVTWRPVVTYDKSSSLAHKRNPGKVAVGGAIKEDVEFLISQGHLIRDEVVIEHARCGHPIIEWETGNIILPKSKY